MKHHIDSHTYVIRCNDCMHIYPEDEIRVKEDGETEYCEFCGAVGKAMDLGQFCVTDDKILFPKLHSCKGWEKLKTNCDLSTLCYFENEIYDYSWEQGEYSTPCDNYPSIIQWWEGIMDTEELLENFGKEVMQEEGEVNNSATIISNDTTIHYKKFFNLLTSYYNVLDKACAKLDEKQEEENEEYDENDEETRLALHIILDAIDQIDDKEFWDFIDTCNKNKK